MKYAFLLLILLVACSQSKLSQEQIDAEAFILASEINVDYQEARDLAGMAFRAGKDKIAYASCDGDYDIYIADDTMVNYVVDDFEKKSISLHETCEGGQLIEQYCEDGRPATKRIVCDCKDNACSYT